MPTEIEKKYLLRENGISYGTDELRELSISIANARIPSEYPWNRVRQGYLPLEKGKTLAKKFKLKHSEEISEARLRAQGDKFFLTIKGKGTLSREEHEKEITREIFEKNWDSTLGKRIEKIRLEIPYQGLIAEIDNYLDRDLTIAEIECPSIEASQNIKPLGKDITENPKYKNKNLAK